MTNKTKTKLKKYEQLRDKARSKALEEATRILDKYFPKNKSKKRGEAMALLAVSFNEGFSAGEDLWTQSKHFANKKL